MIEFAAYPYHWTKGTYIEISARDLPATTRWDTPREHQGQIVEVSYSWGVPGVEEEADRGSPYQRVIDRSIGAGPQYYRLRIDASI